MNFYLFLIINVLQFSFHTNLIYTFSSTKTTRTNSIHLLLLPRVKAGFLENTF